MKHEYDIVRDAFRGDHWLVVCSCGYRSGMFPRKVEAQMNAEEHARGEGAVRAAIASEVDGGNAQLDRNQAWGSGYARGYQDGQANLLAAHCGSMMAGWRAFEAGALRALEYVVEGREDLTDLTDRVAAKIGADIEAERAAGETP